MALDDAGPSILTSATLFFLLRVHADWCLDAQSCIYNSIYSCCYADTHLAVLSLNYNYVAKVFFYYLMTLDETEPGKFIFDAYLVAATAC